MWALIWGESHTHLRPLSCNAVSEMQPLTWSLSHMIYQSETAPSCLLEFSCQVNYRQINLATWCISSRDFSPWREGLILLLHLDWQYRTWQFHSFSGICCPMMEEKKQKAHLNYLLAHCSHRLRSLKLVIGAQFRKAVSFTSIHNIRSEKKNLLQALETTFINWSHPVFFLVQQLLNVWNAYRDNKLFEAMPIHIIYASLLSCMYLLLQTPEELSKHVLV